MVLIPPDAGLRMRMQVESSLLQPVAPSHEIEADLPDFRPGQTFTARIQQALPDHSYQAVVAGKQFTLQLPEGAKSGDELELVVVDRSPRSIIARQIAPATPAAVDNDTALQAFTRLSPAAQTISQLLPADGKAAPPAPLNRGQPLLATPPAQPQAAAQLAPTLAQAITQSGLFYESHQAQWATGQRPLAELLKEPQGQRSLPSAFLHATAEAAAGAGQTSRFHDAQNRALSPLSQPLAAAPPKVGAGETAPTTATPGQAAPPTITGSPPTRPADPENAGAGTGADTDTADGTGIGDKPRLHESQSRSASPMPATATANLSPKVGAGETAPVSHPPAQAAPPAATGSPQKLPDDLRPLVQQQLDTVATQRMVWQGEIWPRQTLEWSISRDNERAADGDTADAAHWNTTLALTTPRLGRIDARLQLAGAGVRIRLATDLGSSATDLRTATPQLAVALESAGVPLLDLQIQHTDEQPARQT